MDLSFMESFGVLRSEREIIKCWEEGTRNELTKPLVSIVCITFNQVSYIEEALQSFLSQITSFPIEIIIHDDVSADGTRELLLKYQKAYPRIITLILPLENQYTISPNLPLSNAFRRCRGDYIAICEGDDYWIDDRKIEKQYIALAKNKGINLCFTACQYLFPKGDLNIGCNHSTNEAIFPPEVVIESGSGFMPTCSLMIKTEVIHNLPHWFGEKAPVGDIFLQILGSISKGAYYLPSVSCVYRIAAENSWSIEQANKGLSQVLKHKDLVNVCLEEINKDTDKLYDVNFRKLQANSYLSSGKLFIKNGQFKDAAHLVRLSWSTFKRLCLTQFILRFFPILYPLFKKRWQ